MADLHQAVKKFSQDLAKKVESFIDDVSTLQVRTYTTSADQIESFVSDQGQPGAATLRAYTKISFDGDTTVCVPMEASGEVNSALWELHQAVVQQAMTNRAEMIRTVGDASASALKALSMTGGS
ncbi:MAG: hypothetical protein JXA89_04915 [Anaerolineae bacterium]|nr:hypothetical protein [Anaerolineae bacterium]